MRTASPPHHIKRRHKLTFVGAWPVIIDEFVAYAKEKIACGYDAEKMVED